MKYPILYTLPAPLYTLYALRYTLYTVFPSTTVENSLQITPFYAKQTQFQKYKMNINTILAMRYENLGTLMGGKTKPKQTQLKPIQTQFKANKAKYKPNFYTICCVQKKKLLCIIMKQKNVVLERDEKEFS